MKSILQVVGIALIIVSLYFVYEIATFSLFDESDIAKIADIEFSDKIYRIYYVPSNATSQSYIQVRSIRGDSEYVLKSFERYNYVNDYALVNDTLRLVLSDTISYDQTADTLLIDLKLEE